MTQRFEVMLAHADATLPQRATHGSAGYDLFSVEERSLHPGTWANVSLGIKVSIPENYYGQMAGRSGLMTNYGLWCFPGVIDSDYRGELSAILYNGGSVRYVVGVGDRVAQLLVLPVLMGVQVAHRVTSLSKTGRGEGGYGSTGK